MATKIKKLLITVAFAPSLCFGAEILHVAVASLCLSSATAHTTCTTSHENGGSPGFKLEFKCEIRRDGDLRDSEYKTFTDLATNGEFTSTLNAALTGSTSVWYCGYNKSKYYNWAGSIPQPGSDSDCVNYRGGSGGGPNPY